MLVANHPSESQNINPIFFLSLIIQLRKLTIVPILLQKKRKRAFNMNEIIIKGCSCGGFTKKVSKCCHFYLNKKEYIYSGKSMKRDLNVKRRTVLIR